MLRLLVVPLLAVILFSVSCATLPYEPYAREVKRRPSDGGTIALKGDHRPEDRAKADTMMTSNCGTSMTPKVTEEGETVVGEKTDSTAQKQNNYYGSRNNDAFKIGGLAFGSSNPSENTTVSATTTQIKEWHISYQCVAANPANAAPVAKRGKKK